MFLDSLSFANGSLAKLSDTLKASGCEFKLLKQWKRLQPENVRKAHDYPWPGDECEPMDSEEKTYVDFILQKRLEYSNSKIVYPHEFVKGGVEQLQRETSLPPKDTFYSRLTGLTPTDKEYQEAENAWNFFSCETLLDFTKIYVELGEQTKKKKCICDFFFTLSFLRCSPSSRSYSRAEESVLPDV